LSTAAAIFDARSSEELFVNHVGALLREGVAREKGLLGVEPNGFVTPESGGVKPDPSGVVSGAGLVGEVGGFGGGTMGADEGPVNHRDGADPPPRFCAETRPAKPAPTSKTAAVVARDGVKYERGLDANLNALKGITDREGNG
jgi:hypothetical protein